MPKYRELADRFAKLGAQIGSSPTADDALAPVTATGLLVIEGADSAGVSWSRGGHFETIAATSELACAVDRIQYELSSGPCVDAAVEESAYVSNDLRAESRWPQFTRRAVAETGVRSMLAVRIYFESDDLVAGLNFYATTLDAFDEEAETAALILATHAALALGSALNLERIENLERALESSRDIGVAMGILMARHMATRQQAFDLLRVASQNSHRKLAAIALDVIETGELEYPRPRGIGRTQPD